MRRIGRGRAAEPLQKARIPESCHANHAASRTEVSYTPHVADHTFATQTTVSSSIWEHVVCLFGVANYKIGENSVRVGFLHTAWISNHTADQSAKHHYSEKVFGFQDFRVFSKRYAGVFVFACVSGWIW